MAGDQPTLNDDEIWKPIPQFEGFYEASTFGRVKGVDREVVGSNGVAQRFHGKLLTPISNGSHYHVGLRTGYQRRKREYVHRLILLTFVGPCPEGMEVCHQDGDPSNNRLSNLRYGTVSENRYDSVKHKTHVEARKTHCPRDHILAEPNLVPSSKKRGGRSCLTCSRADSYIKYHKLEDGLEKVYNSYYQAIMK